MRKSFQLCSVTTSLVLLCAAVSIAQNGYLKTSIDPGRAGVFVDGKYLGPSANFGFDKKFALAPGEHEVKLCDPRFEDVVTKVTITAGKTTVLREKMKTLPVPRPPFGTLRTPQSGDKFAAVYVNERYMGHVDEFSNSGQGLLLSPGEYVVKIVPSSGGAPTEEKVTILANQTTVVRSR